MEAPWDHSTFTKNRDHLIAGGTPEILFDQLLGCPGREKPTKETSYQHIDMLFKDVIDWELIEAHWKDLLRVVFSINAGKILSSTLLRKLGNDSRKNRLYQAFRELGWVVRTTFLRSYIPDMELREQIAEQNTLTLEAGHA